MDYNSDTAEKIPEYLVLGIYDIYEHYEGETILLAMKDGIIYIAEFGYCSCDDFSGETRDSLIGALAEFDHDNIEQYIKNRYINDGNENDEFKTWLLETIEKGK